MPIPNLQHAVDVVVVPADRDATVYDDDFREPVMQAARSSAVTVPGQPNNSLNSLVMQVLSGGAVEGENGYVLFRKVDLDTEGLTIRRDDRVTQIGHVEVDLYVKRVLWCGHYPDAGGATLLKVFLEDRKPRAGAS